MKVLVCGGRSFSDKDMLNKFLDNYFSEHTPDVLIHGGASGADLLARDWARARGIEVRQYSARWNVHKRAAGAIRNQTMLDAEKPDIVIAFPGGKGTDDMVKRSRENGYQVIRVGPEYF